MSWRSTNQEEIGEVWKKLAVNIEEQVLGKYRVDDSKEEPLFDRRRRDEAAGKTKSYERYDKENQIEGKNGHEQQLVGP